MKKLLIVAALVLALAPSTASADWLFTPNVGGVFGGPAAAGVTWGASLGWMGDGRYGVEGDFGFRSNDLFDTQDADLLGIDRNFFDSKVQTFMGNVIVGIPFGGTTGEGFRPYFVGGLGMIRQQVGDADDLFESTNSEFAMDLGGGVFGLVTDAVGLRGDIRWYRAFSDTHLDFDLLDAGVVNRVDIEAGQLVGIDIDNNFWRATAGITFRW